MSFISGPYREFSLPFSAKLSPCLVTKFKILIFFRHLHGDLNLDEIKNVLRLLSVNGETNLMNIIRL